MKIHRMPLIVAAIALLMLSVVPRAAAQSEDTGKGPSTTNVLITFRLGKLDGGRKVTTKTYSLVVAEGTVGSRLLSGQRMPFPEASDGGEMTKIVYQNIGFSSEVRAWVVDKKTIKVMADIEDSRVVDGEGGKPPVVETRQLSVNALLSDGVPLELTRVEGIADLAGFVEVEAKILR